MDALQPHLAVAENTMLAAALTYARGGWHVFPVADAGKQPLTARGHLDATTAADTIRAWWTNHPDARIGVHLRASGLIAVDIDVADGKQGPEQLAELEKLHGPLPRTCHQRSGRGGEHIVMLDPSPGPDGWTRRREDGGSLRGKLASAIDLKCNGYIVLAPSGSYEWLAMTSIEPVPAAWIEPMRKPDVVPGDVEPVDVDVWSTTVKMLCDSDKDQLRGLLADLGERGVGGNTTYKAIRLVCHAYGLSVEDGLPFLQEWNAQCGKPHKAHELQRQIERISRRPIDEDDNNVTSKRGWRIPLRIRIPETRTPAMTRTSGTAVQTCGHVTFPLCGCKPAVSSVQVLASPSEVGPAIASSGGFLYTTRGRVDPDYESNYREALRCLGVRFSYDVFADREFMRRGDGPVCEVTDATILALRSEMERTYDFKARKDDLFDLCTVLARENAYHPVRDYLAALPPPTTTDLTETWLIKFAGAEDTPYVRAVSRLVLVAAVRRARRPGEKFDEMLVLESPQGFGKSSALRALVPAESLFTDHLALGMSSKEIIEQTAGKWIVEVPEMHKKGADLLVKAMLSKQDDSARPAYGRKSQTHRRHFIIIGTTNEERYLFDPTGNRRYWPVRVGEIDLDGLIAARDALWSEAAALEASGASIRLPRDLWPAAAAEQARRVQADAYEDMLGVLANHVGKIRRIDVYKLAGFDTKPPPQPELLRINTAMEAMGWHNRRSLKFAGENANAFVRGTSSEAQDITVTLDGFAGRYSVKVTTA